MIHRPVALNSARVSVLCRCQAFSTSALSRKALPLEPKARVVAGMEGNAGASAGSGGPQMLRGIFFGKPGAGKGTLSARLVEKYDVLSLSVGEKCDYPQYRLTPYVL
jgi:hypothetical protein